MLVIIKSNFLPNVGFFCVALIGVFQHPVASLLSDGDERWCQISGTLIAHCSLDWGRSLTLSPIT